MANPLELVIPQTLVGAPFADRLGRLERSSRYEPYERALVGSLIERDRFEKADRCRWAHVSPQMTRAGTSISPRRKASRNALTTRGSKSVPAPLAMTSLASKSDIALRYGRSLVSES